MFHFLIINKANDSKSIERALITKIDDAIMVATPFDSSRESNSLRRLSVRLILIAFAMFMMSSIMCVSQNYYLMTYSCGILAIIIEGSISLYYQFRGEWKQFQWFSPSIILFIIICVPTLNILKQHQLHVSKTFQQTNVALLLKRNLTSCFLVDHWTAQKKGYTVHHRSYTFKCYKGRLERFNQDNFRLMCYLLTTIQSRPCHLSKTCPAYSLWLPFWSFLQRSCSNWRELMNRFTLVSVLSDELAGLMLIEQLLLLVLVLVNWIWPQTESSGEVYFAQMLRQYLAAAPDIVEFYGNFHQGENLDKLQDREMLQTIIFIIFILSTLQFSMNFQMKVKPTPFIHLKPFSELNRKEKCTVIFEWIFCTSMWSVIYITLTQDLPFLIIRCYFLIKMSDSSNKMVFFLVKNALTILISFHSGYDDIVELRRKLQRKSKKIR